PCPARRAQGAGARDRRRRNREFSLPHRPVLERAGGAREGRHTGARLETAFALDQARHRSRRAVTLILRFQFEIRVPTSLACAPTPPHPFACKTIARPTGWWTPFRSTFRCTRRRPRCARRSSSG